MLIFAYGSLLLPSSLRRTLPDITLNACFPATCRMSKRVFSVAFPNDGSQVDKAYFDEQGERPSFVLFADLQESPGQANGVCFPVSERQLQSLVGRELRYRLIDVTQRISPYPGFAARVEPTYAFLGKPEFTRPEQGAEGVVAASYLQSMIDGAACWESRAPGFWEDFRQSTAFPPPDNVHALRRVDY